MDLTDTDRELLADLSGLLQTEANELVRFLERVTGTEVNHKEQIVRFGGAYPHRVEVAINRECERIRKMERLVSRLAAPAAPEAIRTRPREANQCGNCGADIGISLWGWCSVPCLEALTSRAQPASNEPEPEPETEDTEP